MKLQRDFDFIVTEWIQIISLMDNLRLPRRKSNMPNARWTVVHFEESLKIIRRSPPLVWTWSRMSSPGMALSILQSCRFPEWNGIRSTHALYSPRLPSPIQLPSLLQAGIVVCDVWKKQKIWYLGISVWYLGISKTHLRWHFFSIPFYILFLYCASISPTSSHQTLRHHDDDRGLDSVIKSDYYELQLLILGNRKRAAEKGFSAMDRFQSFV